MRKRLLRSIRRERVEGAAGAAHVLCVSSVLRDRLRDRERVSPDRITIVPCVADPKKFHADEAERIATRRELGLEDRFVVVYPGRFGRWHYGPEMIAVMQGLMRAHSDLFFLVLTPDVPEAEALAKAALPEGRYEIRTARHAEVPRYLRAADLGLLLRAPHPLNEAACPTKFAEYVSCGVPVMISPGIGDCSGFVADHAAGVVLERPDPQLAAAALTLLREEPASPRRARIAGLAERFSRERAAGELAALYRRLAEG
jgi:glycosyltransferase involved in cell wall biosynthesis